MEDKFTCGDCRFSAFLVDEESWWCSKLKAHVNPDLRQCNCPRTDLGEPEENAERDA